MRLMAHADDVPLLGALRTSAVIGAATRNGGYRCTRDGPTKILVPTTPREERRHPEDRDAFCRHVAKEMIAEGFLPPAFAPAPSLTPPTPAQRQVLLMGIASVTVRSPAGP